MPICEDRVGEGARDICEHFNGGSTQGHGPITRCWIVTDDNDDFGGAGSCWGCDIGCIVCLDELDVMLNMADSIDGVRFLAADVPFSKDAEGQTVELVAGSPLLVASNVAFLRAAMFSNTTQFECLGHHPCNAWPYPPFDLNCGPGDLGEPWAGFWPDELFFSGNWPADIDCRRFHETIKRRGDRNIRVEITYPRLGQAVFLRSGRDRLDDYGSCTSNALVPCAGRVVGNSDCDTGELPADKCVPHDRANEVFYTHESAPCHGAYNRAVVVRDSGLIDTPHIIGDPVATAVLDYVLTAEFPTNQQPDGTLNFHQLYHRGIDQTSRLGDFARNWSVANLPAGMEAPIVAPLNARTRFGAIPVQADLIIRAVVIEANLILHRTKHRVSAGTEHHVTPTAVVEIRIELGVRASIEGTPEVGGHPVQIINGDGSQFPGVTPPGNMIRYLDENGKAVALPQRVEWSGRLGAFSSGDPVRKSLGTIGEDDYDSSCANVLRVTGRIPIPGRSMEYGGGMVWSFTEPGSVGAACV